MTRKGRHTWREEWEETLNLKAEEKKNKTKQRWQRYQLCSEKVGKLTSPQYGNPRLGRACVCVFEQGTWGLGPGTDTVSIAVVIHE